MPDNRAARRAAQRRASAIGNPFPVPGGPEVVDLGELAKKPEQPSIITFEEGERPEFPVNTTGLVRNLSLAGGLVCNQGFFVKGADGKMQLQPVMERSQYLDAEQLIEETAQRAAQLVLKGLLAYSAMASGEITREQFEAEYFGPSDVPGRFPDPLEEAAEGLPDERPDVPADLEQPVEIHRKMDGLLSEEELVGPDELTEADRLALGLGPA